MVAARTLSCSNAGNTVTFSVSSLAPGETLNGVVFALLNCSGPPTGTVVNTATVESVTPDPNATNNSSTVSNPSTNPPQSLSPYEPEFPSQWRLWLPSGARVPVCNWQAVSNDTWITITFSSGCCNGSVHYEVAANSGAARTGTMTIAGQTFTVDQAGAPCSFSVLPTSNSFNAAGGNNSFNVTTQAGCNWTATTIASWITITSGSGTGSGTVNYTVGVNPTTSPRNGTILVQGQTHTVNQAANVSPGSTTIGLFNPATSTFFLRNTNSTGVADLSFAYGPAAAGWLSIAGDWNNDGVDTIGLYNPAASTFFLRNSNSTGVADLSFAYGPAGAGWIPIVGDWNGDGVDTIGLYNPAAGTFFLRNSNTTGVADLSFAFGPGGTGLIPLAGDWNGDGIDTIGLYNPSTSAFFLRNLNTTGVARYVLCLRAGGSRMDTACRRLEW